MEFHILGAATQKARAPNERLCYQVTSSTLWPGLRSLSHSPNQSTCG